MQAATTRHDDFVLPDHGRCFGKQRLSMMQGVWADATSRGLAWFAESKKAQSEHILPAKSLLPAVREGQDEGEPRRDRL